MTTPPNDHFTTPSAINEEIPMTQPLSRQQRRAGVLDDPTFERFRTRRWRHILSAALLGILALEAITFGLMGASAIPVAAFIAAIVVLMIGLVFILGALKASTRGVEELSPAVLDERQTQIRGTVYARSYSLVSWVFGATMALLLVAQSGLWEAPTVVPIFLVVIALQLVIVIPTLVTAHHPKV